MTILASGPNLIVCGPPPGVHRRHVRHCPICKRRTRFVESWGGMWYGPTFTCCSCGDSWSDGEIGCRPFSRGWRKDATTRAKAKWANAMTPREYTRWIKAEMAEEFAYMDAQRTAEAVSS